VLIRIKKDLKRIKEEFKKKASRREVQEEGLKKKTSKKEFKKKKIKVGKVYFCHKMGAKPPPKVLALVTCP
jgi:hypothetical protein